MSDTPRTDAKERETDHAPIGTHAYYGWKHSRQLERELAAATAERDALRLVRDRLLAAIDEHNHLMSAECEARTVSDGTPCRAAWQRHSHDVCPQCPRDHRIDLTDVSPSLDAALADARRYRWLRSRDCDLNRMMHYADAALDAAIDAAIDAAMAGK